MKAIKLACIMLVFEFIIISSVTNFNAIDGAGKSVIRFIAFGKNKEVVTELLEKDYGYTTLMIAVVVNDKAGLKSLLSEGADIYIINSSGNTALTLAINYNRKDLLNILQLEQAILQNNNLEPYINKLSRTDLLWFIKRALDNPKIRRLLPMIYKDLAVFVEMNK